MSRSVHSVDWDSIRRLLIVLPSWVGDATMATPFLSSLRGDERLRGVHFTGYMRPGLDQLLDGCDLLDDMIVGRPAGPLGPWKEGNRLASGRFDAAILLPNSWRLAATIRFARIPSRIGYHRNGRGWMLTHRLPCPATGGWKQPISAIDYYLAIATATGIPAVGRRMQVCASPTQREAATTILRQAGIEEGSAFAILNPGASKPEKRWPTERFAALADDLATRSGLRVLINGSPAERLVIDEVCQIAATTPANLVELGVTLGTLKHITSQARLLVTNDTGTRHIAAASAPWAGNARSTLGIVSLFGPTDPRWAQIEYDREKQISTGGKPMSEIGLETVLVACRELLEQPN